MANNLPKSLAVCHPEKTAHGKELCAACYQRYRRRQFPDVAQKHRDANKRYRLFHPNYRKSRQGIERRQRYGLSQTDYDLLMLRANGKCELCQTPAEKLCIDHDHSSGKIRGILCDRCNKALGAYEYIAQFGSVLTNYISRML